DAGAADREAIDRIQPVERAALGACAHERHQREAAVRTQHADRAPQRAGDIVDGAVAPDGQDPIDGVGNAVERHRVAAHEIDVAPAVPADALPRLLEHTVRAVDSDHAAVLADGADEQREVAAGAAADVDDRLAV